MSDWTKAKDRETAAWKFLEKLDKFPKVRQDCLKYPWFARQTFEQVGGFGNLPPSVELRIVEDNKGARDNLHVIAVPPVGKLGTRAKFKPDRFWLASWNLWDQ